MTPELHPEPGRPLRKFSLEEIGVLVEALGRPQERFRSVLVAGTNGKGSTAATLASILAASGVRTGLYTSPHLVRPNERIRVNGAEITDDDFGGVYFEAHDCASRLVLEGRLARLPSFFEILTAMAFLYFARAGVEVAVLEVGMGGRLDATNIVTPLLSIITDISLDHTAWLGETIGAIAREKAGILRAEGTLITLPQHPDANLVIGEVASELGTRAVSAVPWMPAVEPAPGSPWRTEVLGESVEVASPLHGAHQQRNLALAIAAASELATRHGLPVTAASIARGIQQTWWPGRLERLCTPGPRAGRSTEWILDVAHNPAGAWALRAALRREDELRLRCLVFGCLRDKPAGEMARILFPIFDRLILAPVPSPRATPVEELLAAAAATGTPAVEAGSMAEALDLAVGYAHGQAPAAGEEGNQLPPRIVVSGSVYLVGGARPLILARAENRR